MTELTRTALNSDKVQKYYESKLYGQGAEMAAGKRTTSQKGGGLLLNAIGGLVGGVQNVITAQKRVNDIKRRIAQRKAQRQTGKGKTKAKPPRAQKNQSKKNKASSSQTGKGAGRAKSRSAKGSNRRPKIIAI